MIGSLIGGHIRILSALGQGGMGDVYAGMDERLGRRVAVKTIRADRSPNARERFLREARALSALDHPNICRIFEYIESPDGDFLVLELIDGITLDRAIEQGMSYARKLRVAEEILEALVAAHRKGIVHRDLKPDNVMIAADGTVKVLDFGIAHLQALGSVPEDVAVDSEAPVDADATLVFRIAGMPSPRREQVHSAIAGTPVYMSPEQALGYDVTTASDLYSFGLMMQTLLTEEPPQDDSLVAEALLDRAARGESRLLTGQPRDITALVISLKALAPADRPTAPDTLAAVRRIIDAPRRRIRYAVAAIAFVLLLAGAIKYALDITAARAQAESRRHQAESLVRFMVGDLRRKLEPVGRLDVLDSTASRALSYFASLSPEEMTGEDLNQNAQALAQLGQARDKQGKLAQAIDLFRQSVRFGSAAVSRDPSSEESQLALSNAHFWLGDALRRSGDVQGTLQNFGAYFAISQRLAQRHPTDPKFQAEISYAHGNLGAAYELAGDFPRALNEYRMTCTLDRDRLRRDPGNEQWQADLANSANRLGVILQKTGDFSGARNAFDEDLAIRRRLAQSAPEDSVRQQRLGISLAFAGMLQLATGDLDQALASFREEIGLATALAVRDPSNADSRRNRDVAQSRLASILEPSRSARLIDEATSDLRELVRTDGRFVWRRDLALALYRSASIHLQLGDLPRAHATAAAALAASEALVSEKPNDSASKRILCEVLLVAALLDDKSSLQTAATMRRTRVAEIAKKAPDDPVMTALLVRALLPLGRDEEAAPLARTLLSGGYREPQFTAALAGLHPPHSPPARSHP
jgi:tetratricopeptide (TPR) repeat protein